MGAKEAADYMLGIRVPEKPWLVQMNSTTYSVFKSAIIWTIEDIEKGRLDRAVDRLKKLDKIMRGNW